MAFDASSVLLFCRTDCVNEPYSTTRTKVSPIPGPGMLPHPGTTATHQVRGGQGTEGVELRIYDLRILSLSTL